MLLNVTLRGVLAGVIHTLLWHVAVLCGWLFESTLPIYACAIVAGVLINLCLYQRGSVRYLLTLALAVGLAALCVFLSNRFDLHALILKAVMPGYGRMSAGNTFAITAVSVIFYGVTILALMVAMFIRPKGKPEKKGKPAAPEDGAAYAFRPSGASARTPVDQDQSTA